MKNIIYLLIIYTFFLIFPKSVIATYAEAKGAECYYYKANKLISYSKCDVESSWGFNGGFSIWKWYNGNEVGMNSWTGKLLINDKPGFPLGESYRKGFRCWGIRGSKDVLCTNGM